MKATLECLERHANGLKAQQQDYEFVRHYDMPAIVANPYGLYATTVLPVESDFNAESIRKWLRLEQYGFIAVNFEIFACGSGWTPEKKNALRHAARPCYKLDQVRFWNVFGIDYTEDANH